MIHQIYKIKAPVEKVWEALTDPKIIEVWSGQGATMDGEEGTRFNLWGGDIFGTNTKVEKEKLLEQDWFGSKKWENPSKVIMSLSEKEGSTEIDLQHSEIPLGEEDDFASGWKDYYFGPMKELLES